MEPFTMFIVLVMIVSGAWGWHKGFLKQGAQVVALILGIAACRIFGASLAAFFCGEDASTADTVLYTIMAYVVLFIVVFFGVFMLVRVLLGIMHTLHIGVINRLGGALFGICKWLFVISMVLNMWVAISPKTSVSESAVYDKVVAFGPWLLGTETAAQLGKAVSKAVHG